MISFGSGVELGRGKLCRTVGYMTYYPYVLFKTEICATSSAGKYVGGALYGR